MRTWTCPKCGDRIDALAVAVAHRCPANKNRATNYAPQNDTEEN